jgi:hypothetical protein
MVGDLQSQLLHESGQRNVALLHSQCCKKCVVLLF